MVVSKTAMNDPTSPRLARTEHLSLTIVYGGDGRVQRRGTARGGGGPVSDGELDQLDLAAAGHWPDATVFHAAPGGALRARLVT